MGRAFICDSDDEAGREASVFFVLSLPSAADAVNTSRQRASIPTLLIMSDHDLHW